MNAKNNNNNTNFWISYADLMAGLLFVFILLIGAIIVKYSLLQSESKLLEKSLNEEKIALEKNKKELKEKEQKIKNVVHDLEKTRKDLSKAQENVKKTKEDLKNSLLEKEKIDLLLSEQKQKNENQKNKLDKKDEELKILALLKKEFEDKLKESNLEKEQLTASLKELEVISQEKDKKADSLLEEILLKERMINSFKDQNDTLSDELKVISLKLKTTQEEHTQLSSDLQNTKQKIKNLTGIKIKVISLLKTKLGKKIEIDPNNGSLRLSSNILFEQGKYDLKETSKESLKSAVYDYFKTILENDEINKHVDKIVIEGHTNSKGNFLYNLELSQKRAYSVMDFLLSLDFKNKENLKKLVVASGRSFLDPIYTESGEEDMDSSRRIEIKFSLKNEDAIKEIANILN